MPTVLSPLVLLMRKSENENRISLTLTPQKLSYRMPAEWEEHEATWLAWPHNFETWPAQLPQVEAIYVEMIRALVKGEKVHLLVNGNREEEKVKDLLSKNSVRMSQVLFFTVPTVDVWVRDYGPIFVVKKDAHKKELALTHWIFNAWGEKYELDKVDREVPKQLVSLLGIPFFEPRIVLEGGSVDVNGEGIALTTEQCLLDPKRNPHLKKEEIEAYLKHFLGLSHIHWLGKGIVGDDTDGHVDNVARFVSQKAILCAVEEDSKDVNYPFLQDNLQRLKRATDESGKKFNVIELPMPGKVQCSDKRLPASYANFYIGNEVVLVPIYQHPNDRIALQILGDCFPTREVIGVLCEPLVYGLGSIHCVTQQQPKSDLF